MQNTSLDDLDRKILNILAEQGRIQNIDLSREIGIAPSATLNRTKKLEAAGVIESYQAKLNGQLVGKGFLTFVLVRINGQSTTEDLVKAFRKETAILEIHQTAGDDCFLLKIRTSGTEEYSNLLNGKISKIKGVEGTKSIISLVTYKETLSPTI